MFATLVWKTRRLSQFSDFVMGFWEFLKVRLGSWQLLRKSVFDSAILATVPQQLPDLTECNGTGSRADRRR